MPKVIDDFSSVRGRKPTYPADWFDGQSRAFTQGRDFECEPRRFRKRLSDAARARGLEALAEVVSGEVHFRVVGKHPLGARCGHSRKAVSLDRPVLQQPNKKG